MLISGVLGGEAYGENPVGGVLLGLFTGAAYAGFLLVQRLGNRDPRRPAGPLMDATASSAVASAAAGLVLGQIVPPVLAVPRLAGHPRAQRAGGRIPAHQRGLPRLPSALTSIVLLIQPVAAVGFAMLILGESPSPTQLWRGTGRRRGAAGHRPRASRPAGGGGGGRRALGGSAIVPR